MMAHGAMEGWRDGHGIGCAEELETGVQEEGESLLVAPRIKGKLHHPERANRGTGASLLLIGGLMLLAWGVLGYHPEPKGAGDKGAGAAGAIVQTLLAGDEGPAGAQARLSMLAATTAKTPLELAQGAASELGHR